MLAVSSLMVAPGDAPVQEQARVPREEPRAAVSRCVAPSYLK